MIKNKMIIIMIIKNKMKIHNKKIKMINKIIIKKIRLIIQMILLKLNQMN